MLESLVILGCSQRKVQTPGPMAAIERYDGPAFRVFRRHRHALPGGEPAALVLSALFGLIPGDFPIPVYDRQLKRIDLADLRTIVEAQLKDKLAELAPRRIFVSVGRRYWSLLEQSLTRETDIHRICVASGGIGGRTSQLAHWLRNEGPPASSHGKMQFRGEAFLLGTVVRLSQDEVFRIARAALPRAGEIAHRFETWYVALDGKRLAPKWLVSILFQKPVAQFRAADARRVLAQLGVDTFYADR